MKNRCAEITEWLRKAVWILFAVIIGYLLISSIFSTCYTGTIEYTRDDGTIGRNFEHTFWVRDNWWIHFIIFGVISILLYVRKEDRKIAGRWKLFSGIILLGILFYIVCAGKCYPQADQKQVVEIAASFNQGDYTALDKGEYLYINPHQIGIVLYFFGLTKIFGELNIVAFKIVNIFWSILSFAEIIWLGSNIAKGNKNYQKAMTALAMVLFLPWSFYVTYLYGIVPGEALALGAICFTVAFKKKKKMIYVVWGSLCIAGAVLLKSNFLIFAVGILLYIFLECINGDGRIRSFFFLSMIMICLVVGKFSMNAYMEKISNEDKIRGVPMLAYVEMGLQDSILAPGWYNKYNHNIYKKYDYNYEKTLEVIKKDMLTTISYYYSNPREAVDFFVKKISSQWNNPTFQSLWLLEESPGKAGLEWIQTGNGRYIYSVFVNILQTIIYAGTLICTIARLKKGNLKEMLVMLIFIGGFVFHIFWEAKSTYAIPFFLLLIPICCNGWIEWEGIVKRRINSVKESGMKKENKRFLSGILLVGILICVSSYTSGFKKIFARNDDTVYFNTYTQNIVNYEETEIGEK